MLASASAHGTAYLSLAGTMSRRAERGGMSADDVDWCRSGWWTGACLINASTGAILTTFPVGSTGVSGRSVFVQGTLFVGTETNGLCNFAPLIAPRLAPAGQCTGGAIVTAQAGTMDRLTWPAEPGVWRNRRAGAGVQPA